MYLCSYKTTSYKQSTLLFFQTCAMGKCTGISIIDSTPLMSCHIKRMHMHKTRYDVFSVKLNSRRDKNRSKRMGFGIFA